LKCQDKDQRTPDFVLQSKESSSRAPAHPSAFVRAPTDLADGRFREYRVQPRLQKYFASRFGRNSFIDSAIPPDKGAYRDRHGRAAGCGGRGDVVCAIVDRRAGFP
jgi:hypothetical protein